jgi:ubiquinone/menaquinone biosynthesis C-methylase UbiE
MQEQLVEPLLRRMRIARILPVIRSMPECSLLDVGCGREACFLKDVAPYIQSGVGIDFKAPQLNTGKIRTISMILQDSLPFPDRIFDVVSMLAVLEHIEHEEAIVREIRRVLRPGGFLVGTAPGKIAKPVLEFLSFKLNIVNPEEIKDHKRYYDKNSLHRLLSAAGFTTVKHAYFQLGMNNFFTAGY